MGTPRKSELLREVLAVIDDETCDWKLARITKFWNELVAFGGHTLEALKSPAPPASDDDED